MRRLALFLALPLLACPATDDDDAPRTIPPPAGCSLTALEVVTFDFNIHWNEVDYPQSALNDLLLAEEPETRFFAFGFPGIVTQLEESGSQMLLTITDPGDPEEPPEDPNRVQLEYRLPRGYEMPVAMDQELGVELVINGTSGDLFAAASLDELIPDELPSLMFMTEPAELGMAYPLTDSHPLFTGVEVRDRGCPSTSGTDCAEIYNLSQVFTTKLSEDGSAGGETFEVWPTEHRDFNVGGPELRVVNTGSYTHREIQNCNQNYDFTALRSNFFVIRADAVN